MFRVAIYTLFVSTLFAQQPEPSLLSPVRAPTVFTTMTRTRLSPTLQGVPQFNIGGKQYVVALTPNFASYIGRPNMLAGMSFVAAKPGDTVTIYALGLGPTNPGTSAGVTASATGAVTLPLQLKIGSVQANVPFSGLLKDTIELFQLNVVIPNVAAGEQKIELTVDGVTNNQDLVHSSWAVVASSRAFRGQ